MLKSYNDLDVISIGIILGKLTSSLESIIPDYPVTRLYQSISLAHYTYGYFNYSSRQ